MSSGSLDEQTGHPVEEALVDWGDGGSSQGLLDALSAAEGDAAQLAAQLLALMRAATSQGLVSDDALASILAEWVQLDQISQDNEQNSPSSVRESALLDAIWILDQELSIYSWLASEQAKPTIANDHTRLNSLTSQLLVRSHYRIAFGFPFPQRGPRFIGQSAWLTE